MLTAGTERGELRTTMARKTLNVGLVGYGFMGRTHSNAFLQAPRFFDVPCEPGLKAVCARHAERARARAARMVMCERRLGRSAAEAEQMVSTVEAAGVPNSVWYNYRRVPAVML